MISFNLVNNENYKIDLTFLSETSTPNTNQNKTPAEIDNITLYSKDPNFEGDSNYYPDEEDLMEREFSDLDQ